MSNKIRFTMMWDKDLLDAFRQRCKAEHKTMTAVMNGLLEKYMAGDMASIEHDANVVAMAKLLSEPMTLRFLKEVFLPEFKKKLELLSNIREHPRQ